MATMNTLAAPQAATSTWNIDPVHILVGGEVTITLDAQFVKA